MRRDLLWSVENTNRVVHDAHGALSTRNRVSRKRRFNAFSAILDALESARDDGILDAKLPQITEDLWSLAIEIEEGDVIDTMQQCVNTKPQPGDEKWGLAPEIERLMQELKEANENYMRQLRQQSERAGRNEFDQSTPGEQMNMDMADIQAMMDRIKN